MHSSNCTTFFNETEVDLTHDKQRMLGCTETLMFLSLVLAIKTVQPTTQKINIKQY